MLTEKYATFYKSTDLESEEKCLKRAPAWTGNVTQKFAQFISHRLLFLESSYRSQFFFFSVPFIAALSNYDSISA